MIGFHEMYHYIWVERHCRALQLGIGFIELSIVSIVLKVILFTLNHSYYCIDMHIKIVLREMRIKKCLSHEVDKKQYKCYAQARQK
jgi:hypothetical protein